MSTSNKKGPADFRSSVTGQFVKPSFAKAHPKETEKEHNRPKDDPPKKGGK